MITEVRLIVDALDLAAHAHGRQNRKAMGDSYLVHVAEVTKSCAGHEPFDPVLVTAAILHDIVEDTDVTLEEIDNAFGDEIAGVVAEVTDAPDIDPKRKHLIQAEHMKIASTRARLLKIADKTSNVMELVDLPKKRRPSVKTLKAYLEGARGVIDNCRGLDTEMEARFDAAALRLETLVTKLEKKRKSK